MSRAAAEEVEEEAPSSATAEPNSPSAGNRLAGLSHLSDSGGGEGARSHDKPSALHTLLPSPLQLKRRKDGELGSPWPVAQSGSAAPHCCVCVRQSPPSLPGPALRRGLTRQSQPSALP